MGNTCCGKDFEMAPPNGAPRNLETKIYGDWFDRDTRTLLIMCDYAETIPDFELIDTFNKGNQETSYKEIFGTTVIPSIKIK